MRILSQTLRSTHSKNSYEVNSISNLVHILYKRGRQRDSSKNVPSVGEYFMITFHFNTNSLFGCCLNISDSSESEKWTKLEFII